MRKRFRHGAVDDLEVAAAGELLELHQREVGLDAGGVAIHDEADRAGRRDDGGLRVAVAVLLAELERAVPGARARARSSVWSGQARVVERHRRCRELLVARRLAMGGAAVVADDAQHVLAVLLVARERPELAPPSRPRSHRTTPVMIAVSAPQMRAAFGRIVGDAGGHQQAADIGVAEAERAVVVGELARSPSTGTAPSAPRFRARWSTAARHARSAATSNALVVASRNCSRFSEARLHAVSSRNMYSEHGFDARIAPDAGQVCQSLMVVWNCMPGSAEAQAA